jgi:hypothetical protein
MCVKHLSWEASDGKKREVPLSSIIDLKNSHYFSVLYNFFVLTPRHFNEEKTAQRHSPADSYLNF